jgi:hypothetical protein
MRSIVGVADWARAALELASSIAALRKRDNATVFAVRTNFMGRSSRD